MPIHLVHHAAETREADQLPALWHLSDEGRRTARSLARDRVWRDIVRIFTSPEWPAHETAQIIAGSNGITVTVIEDLRELGHPRGQPCADALLPHTMAAYFAGELDCERGWEPLAAARARIFSCIETLRSWESRPFAVMTHKAVLSLYIAAVTGAEPASVWRSINSPDLAAIESEQRRLVLPFGTWRPR